MKTGIHLAITVLFVVLANSCTTEALETTGVPETENATGMEAELLTLLNEHRKAMGYQGLEFSEVAYDYANKHTNFMIATGTISHDNFSARASGISAEAAATQVAENVAKEYATAQKAFDEWLASAGHRKNIEGDFSHTAVSVKMDTKGIYYFTQLFYKQ